MIAAIAAAVSAPSTLRLTSGGAGFSGAWAAAGWVLIVGAELLVALGAAVVAIGGDTEAVKATRLATEGCGCATAATAALLTGLLWRPI
jgi:hypothetical protein